MLQAWGGWARIDLNPSYSITLYQAGPFWLIPNQANWVMANSPKLATLKIVTSTGSNQGRV